MKPEAPHNPDGTLWLARAGGCVRVLMTRFAILALSMVACGCSIAPRIVQVHSVEEWFIGQSPSYYSNLAHACNAVLRAHPTPPNAFNFVDLRESPLPRLITDL